MFFVGLFKEGLFILSFRKKKGYEKMKNTRKFLSVILALALSITLAFSLIGCDIVETEGETTEAPKTTAAETEAPATDDATTEIETNKVEKAGLWENATYLNDMTFGNGSKTLCVEVKVGDDTVIFTVKTDKETVGDALMEHKLIDGEDGAYGLYVKKVNGILADYDVDRSYWAFYINGEYAMSGVDITNIDTSATYKLEYTK